MARKKVLHREPVHGYIVSGWAAGYRRRVRVRTRADFMYPAPPGAHQTLRTKLRRPSLVAGVRRVLTRTSEAFSWTPGPAPRASPPSEKANRHAIQLPSITNITTFSFNTAIKISAHSGGLHGDEP